MSSPHIPTSPRPVTPFELDKPKLLIGEGKDEAAIFSALLKHLGIDDIQVEDYGGKGNLPDYLDALLLRPGFTNLISLGVTRDADTDAGSAFTSVNNYLRQRGFIAPASSGSVQIGMPSVGIMILPDGQHPGMLEDLFLAALQADSSLRCIEEYFACIRAAKGSLPNQISKARVHAWLAVQEPPDMRLGFAAQRGLIDWGVPAFDQLRNFLISL